MHARRWMAAGLLAVLLAGATAACGGDDDAGDAGEASTADAGGAEAERGLAYDGAPQPVGRSEDAPSLADDGGQDEGAFEEEGLGAAILPGSDTQVIKTATLRIEVGEESFREAVQDAIAIAESRGGFVFSSSIKDERHKRGSVVIRVPARSFEAALADAEAIGDVTGQNVTGEDVSQEFIDLRSRLRNFEGQETVLLRLYDRATSVADTIRIQREVQGVQLEIERLRGQIRFLEDKTSFSTITLELSEAGAPGPEEEPSGTLARAWDNARDAFLGVVSAVIVGAGALLPIALLLGLLVLGLRSLRPRPVPEARGEG